MTNQANAEYVPSDVELDKYFADIEKLQKEEEVKKQKKIKDYYEAELARLQATPHWSVVLAKKPSWKDAPDECQSLALNLIMGEDYGDWCWMYGDGNSPGFVLAEKRPA